MSALTEALHTLEAQSQTDQTDWITSRGVLGVPILLAQQAVIEDVVAYLQSGHNRISAASGPMAEVVSNSTSQMTAADLKAMAAYSVPTITRGVERLVSAAQTRVSSVARYG